MTGQLDLCRCGHVRRIHGRPGQTFVTESCRNRTCTCDDFDPEEES